MSTTPNLGLALPANGSPNWDVPVNGNATVIDTVVGGGTAGAVLTSQGPNSAPVYRTPVNNETPLGTINGTTGSDGNPVFTLANTPAPLPGGGTTLKLTKNGQEVYVGVAFTLLANVITYLAPYIPVTGDLHRATYSF